jgi:hypothetical protein
MTRLREKIPNFYYHFNTQFFKTTRIRVMLMRNHDMSVILTLKIVSLMRKNDFS